MRFFPYAPQTEATDWQWISQDLRFHKRPGVAVRWSARLGPGFSSLSVLHQTMNQSEMDFQVLSPPLAARKAET